MMGSTSKGIIEETKMIYLVATITLVTLYFIGLFFFEKTLFGVLVVVGFFVALLLPIFIYSRTKASERREKADRERITVLRKKLRDLEEVEERLEGSIEGFKQFGWVVKEYDKTDEEGFYADIALEREAGLDARGLSGEYGDEVKYLIIAHKKIQNIKYGLQNI